MLKIAVISDIHANLPAFESVLADIDFRHVDQIFCLGDLVDFAPWPNEVIELIRRNRIPTLMGNHDERIAFDQPIVPLEKHNPVETQARTAAIDFTREAISPVNKAFLASLPRQLRLSFLFADRSIDILLVHASTRAIDEYIYEQHNQADVEAMMNENKADVLIMGHTHRSYIRRFVSNTSTNPSPKIAINCGSVGRTKETDSLATYLLITVSGEKSTLADDSITYELIKVRYPVDQTIDGISQSPVPDFYADFLRESLTVV